MEKRTVKLFSPYVPEDAIIAAAHVLNSPSITQGPLVEEFEREFCKRFGLDDAVSVNSGTAALETAYDLLELGVGDEVITTPLTCIATNMPLLRLGCKLIWADVDPNTLCIDAKDVQRKVTDRTAAVVIVNLGGIAAKRPAVNVPIVADSCQALGIFNGDYTACSFQAIKHITTGDGGMFVANNPDDARKARLARWFGIDRSRPTDHGWEAYKTRMITCEPHLRGTKRHMNDIEAALGLAGLKHYDRIRDRREILFNLYRTELAGVPGIRLVDGESNTHWLCTVLVEYRDGLAKKLYQSGIETNIVQSRNDVLRVFGGHRADLPWLNMIESKYLSLPIGMHVDVADVQYICGVIKQGW